MAETKRDFWTPAGRAVVFVLGSSSIACLLADFYRVCSMRQFALYGFIPALVVLGAIAAADRVQGSGRLYRAVLLGAGAGLAAAVSYDIFRLPFVYAKAWGIAGIVPPLDLFKVFPAFGAMLLRQPLEQTHYSPGAELLGWAYHFSNGLTFGIMYLALVGTGRRHHWTWAIAFAVVLELGMLVTPYPHVFGIPLTFRFIWVTLAAHAIFGVILGLLVRVLSREESREALATA